MIRLRRKSGLALGAAAAVLVGTGVLAANPATALGSDTAAADIVTIPVSFSVANSNNTAVACTSDGATYTIRGHITAPAGALVNPKSATLYLHAVTQGEFYWMFNGVPGYNFAQQMAGQGHIAVTIDRLGYGASDRPPGMSSCFGSQATTAHEVIQDLKTGKYTVGANPTLAAPVAFPQNVPRRPLGRCADRNHREFDVQ